VAAGRGAVCGIPPDFGELAAFPSHVGRVVREAVVVAATEANRDRDEALADRIGRRVIVELVEFLNTRKAPEPRQLPPGR
jgi:hypothetical protein